MHCEPHHFAMFWNIVTGYLVFVPHPNDEMFCKCNRRKFQRHFKQYTSLQGPVQYQLCPIVSDLMIRHFGSVSEHVS